MLITVTQNKKDLCLHDTGKRWRPVFMVQDMPGSSGQAEGLLSAYWNLLLHSAFNFQKSSFPLCPMQLSEKGEVTFQSPPHTQPRCTKSPEATGGTVGVQTATEVAPASSMIRLPKDRMRWKSTEMIR